jgi:hypothetical protein
MVRGHRRRAGRLGQQRAQTCQCERFLAGMPQQMGAVAAYRRGQRMLADPAGGALRAEFENVDSELFNG